LRKEMKLLRTFYVLAFGAFLLLAAGPANAGESLRLSDTVKANLIAAKPVTGPGVDRALFDGKPLLVTFFASW